MRAVVIVEADEKIPEVRLVFTPHAFDQFLGLDAQLARFQHDGRAVCVVGADVDAVMPAQLLEAHPDVGLDIFHQMPQMDRPVGVGQRAGDEDFSYGFVHEPMFSLPVEQQNPCNEGGRFGEDAASARS
jgi:hypothetical protein